MAIQAQNEKLNIVPGGIIPVVHASQYDVDRVLTFTLYDGLSAASLPSGVTGLIEGTKPDNKGFQYAVTSISNNVVTIVTTKQMTAVKGTVKCKIVLLKDNMVLGTALFFLEVDEAGLADDTDISATELPFIRDMAETNMLEAEAWARGTRNNVPVASTDETYHNNSKYYSEQSSGSATAAAGSATAAANSATAAAGSATAAANSATAAADSESNAAESEASAEESEANAAISAADAKAYADLFFGFLRPKGQITFAELPPAAEALAGDWYVISDAFVTTSDFVVGAGVSIDAGANVYMTVNDKWGIIQGSLVGGVKGNAESTYRTGQVNLTYGNIGSATEGRVALGLGDANGALPITIAQGGTGLTSSPSMLTNLGSTSADKVLQATPRPGVTGTLGIGNGGTGATSRLNAAKNLTNENVGTSATHFVTLTDSWGKFGYSSAANARSAMGLGNTTGALPVANGGTGATKAADARSNLGLGDAATYSVGSVKSGNTGLVTGGSVYSYIKGWTLQGSKTGKGAISLPSSYTELLIIVMVWNNVNVSFHIPQPYLSSTTVNFVSGRYYGSSSEVGAQININQSSVSINIAHSGGTNVTANAKIYAYYR